MFGRFTGIAASESTMTVDSLAGVGTIGTMGLSTMGLGTMELGTMGSGRAGGVASGKGSSVSRGLYYVCIERL